MNGVLRGIVLAVPHITRGLVVGCMWCGLSLSALFPLGFLLASLNADRVSKTSILPLWAMVVTACIFGAQVARGVPDWWKDLSLFGRALWGPACFAVGITSAMALVLIAMASG